MPSYRFYKIGSDNRIFAPPDDFDFDDDAQALQHGLALADGHAIDGWLGTRFIARVAVPDNPPKGDAIRRGP